MDAEMFSVWLDGVRSLSPEQRRKAFMVIALREADDEPDWVSSEAANTVRIVDAPAAIATPLGGAGQNRAAPVPPIDSDGKRDALSAAASRRVQTRGCPHCDAKDVRPWGRAHGLPRYRCTDCRRTFNALSGTSMARLRHKDRWLDQARALMTGESVAAAAARCGVRCLSTDNAIRASALGIV
jgi:transposase-like protein